jgi:hypothetical protein
MNRRPAIITFMIDDTPKLMENHRWVCREMDSVRAMLLEYPELFVKIYRMRKGANAKFEEYIESESSAAEIGLTRTQKAKSARLGYGFLDDGRKKLTEGDHGGAFYMFSQSNRYFVETMRPPSGGTQTHPGRSRRIAQLALITSQCTIWHCSTQE